MRTLFYSTSTASILCDKLRLKNAYAFDLQAACSGFLYLMETAANFIRSGRYKKAVSYTHLDVYKRQPLGCWRGNGPPSLRWIGVVRGRSPTLELRRGPNSYPIIWSLKF